MCLPPGLPSHSSGWISALRRVPGTALDALCYLIICVCPCHETLGYAEAEPGSWGLWVPAPDPEEASVRVLRVTCVEW